LGLAVKTQVGVSRMMGSAGSFSWPGASGTDWWVDPREDLVVVYLSAAPGPLRWYYRQKINALVYQAFAD
jgi:CubicO group peptidase (beta-lactamase class C family)